MSDPREELDRIREHPILVDRIRAITKHGSDALLEEALIQWSAEAEVPSEIPTYSDEFLDQYAAGELTDLEWRRLRWHAAHSSELGARLSAAEMRYSARIAGEEQSATEQSSSRPALRLVLPMRDVLAPRRLGLAARDQETQAESGIVVTNFDLGTYEGYITEDAPDDRLFVSLLVEGEPATGVTVVLESASGARISAITGADGIATFAQGLAGTLDQLGEGERTISLEAPLL